MTSVYFTAVAPWWQPSKRAGQRDQIEQDAYFRYRPIAGSDG